MSATVARQNECFAMDLRIADRPTFRELTPDAEQKFRQEQAAYEAAYRCTGNPRVLVDAFLHAWGSRQTVVGWLVLPICDTLIRNQTDQEAERLRERMRHVRRYLCVRDLRWQGHTKDRALDRAEQMLAGETGMSRSNIETSYDSVRKSLKRLGRESEYFCLVGKSDEALGVKHWANDTPDR
jgi:hypothetical protein